MALAAATFLLAGGAVLFWAAGAAKPAPAEVSEKDNGGTINLAVGSRVRVSLRGFPIAPGQTADAWGPIETSDRSVVEVIQEGSGVRLPWDVPVTTATLVARSPGQAQVTSTICNPRAASCGRFVVTVVATPRPPP